MFSSYKPEPELPTPMPEKLQYNIYPNININPSAPEEETGLPQYIPYSSSSSEDKSQGSEASAPAMDNALGFSRLSYDQVVNWWNDLPKEQRQAILRAAQGISAAQLDILRNEYKKFYPNEYYPKKAYIAGQISTTDCCILFHFADELQRKRSTNDYLPETQQKFMWFTDRLHASLQPLPPSYEQTFDESKNVPNTPPPNYHEATQEAATWFNNMDAHKQHALRENAARMSPQQIIIIRRQLARVYPSYRYDTRRLYVSDFDLFLMNYYQARFVSYIWFNSLRASFHLTALAVRTTWNVSTGLLKFGVNAASATFNAIGSGASAVSGYLGQVGSGGKKNSKDTNLGDKIKGLAILTLVVAVITIAVGGIAYGLKKLGSQLWNLAHGKKLARSLFKLGSLSAGVALGWTQGALIGAAIGSVFPGVGTAAGAVIGSICFSGIFGAMFYAAAKWTAKFLATAQTGETNPARHNRDLAVTNLRVGGELDNIKSQQQVLELFTPGVLNNEKRETEVMKDVMGEMFNDIKQAKAPFKVKFGSIRDGLKASIPGSKGHKAKQALNEFTEAVVEKGKNPLDPVRMDKNKLMFWDRAHHQILTLDKPMPTPVKEPGLTVSM